MKTQSCSAEAALTRAELLSVVAALGLLAITVWPMRANARKSTNLAACGDNLHHIGQAWQSWLAENGPPYPWRRSPAAGGLMSTVWVQDAFRSFQYLSNHLASPELLVCPADTNTVMRATNWAAFELSPYRGNALSYIVGTDAAPDSPQGLLSGDRHFVGTRRELCSAGSRGLAVRTQDLAVGWNTNALHGAEGNLLMAGGSVLTHTSAELRNYLVATTGPGDPPFSVHFLPPR